MSSMTCPSSSNERFTAAIVIKTTDTTTLRDKKRQAVEAYEAICPTCESLKLLGIGLLERVTPDVPDLSLYSSSVTNGGCCVSGCLGGLDRSTLQIELSQPCRSGIEEIECCLFRGLLTPTGQAPPTQSSFGGVLSSKQHFALNIQRDLGILWYFLIAYRLGDIILERRLKYINDGSVGQ